MMAIKYRAEKTIGLTQLQPEDPNLPPAILAPGQSAVPTAFVTDAPPSATPSSTPLSTPSSAATTSSQSSVTAAPTHSAAASKGGSGLSHGDIAAIVIPIALLAVLIPILVLWCLDRRHRAAAQKRSSNRSSNEAMLQKVPSIQKPPQQKGPKPARPQRTPTGSVVDPPIPETRNSLGLFNFELSPPSTPGVGWMSPNPRFSVARALQMRRSQPSLIQAQPRTSRGESGESDRPQTGYSERSERRQVGTSRFDPPPPYVIDAAPPKPVQISHFAPLERIGTLQPADRSHGPMMQPSMAPTLPAIATTNGALDVPQPGYTPRHTPSPSSEILQRPDVYGRAYTRSPSPSLSMHNDSSISRPFSYTVPERISDISGLSDEPEPWRRMRESHGSSTISPIDSDESSSIHPHQIF